MRFILLSSLFIAGYAEALLPPLYTTLSEYKSLLNDERLEKMLSSGEAIRDIRREDNGFIITTTKNKLVVDVVYQPAQKPGPGEFKLNFHTLEPLNAK